MSDCEMQRIDKPTTYSAFWNAHPAGYLSYRRKGLIGQSQQKYLDQSFRGFRTKMDPISSNRRDASKETCKLINADAQNILDRSGFLAIDVLSKGQKFNAGHNAFHILSPLCERLIPEQEIQNDK
jgi:hypothetical protein